MSGLVGKVSIAYNRMDVDELGAGTCRGPAQKCFNSHNRTVSQWNDCIFDYYCDTDDIMPGMQGKGLRPSGAIQRAEDLLDSLDPGSPNYEANALANND